MGERDYKNQRKAKKLEFDAYLIDEGLRTKGKFKIKLRYVVQDDTVRYSLIKSIDTSHSFESIREDIEIIRDRDYIQKYTLKHNEIYKTKKQPNDFIKEIIVKDKCVRIGAGHHGKGYGEDDIELFRAVKNKDKDFIINLLKSMNLEDQTLGIVGVIKLKSEGVEFDEEIELIIKHIKKRDSSISCDFACTSLEMKMNRYLSAINWDRVPNIEIE